MLRQIQRSCIGAVGFMTCSFSAAQLAVHRLHMFCQNHEQPCQQNTRVKNGVDDMRYTAAAAWHATSNWLIKPDQALKSQIKQLLWWRQPEMYV